MLDTFIKISSKIQIFLKKHGPLDKVISVTKKNLFVKMDQECLLKACTEIVTVNGRPFTIFYDSGFQKILRPLTEAIGASMKLILN